MPASTIRVVQSSGKQTPKFLPVVRVNAHRYAQRTHLTETVAVQSQNAFHLIYRKALSSTV